MSIKIYKSSAKVNIFLKITGKKDNYHKIISRFVLVNDLYDKLYFVKSKNREFEIIGDFTCATEQNTIFKAYRALRKVVNFQLLDNFMNANAIKVEKNIPAFAGLGGGSSNAACFLLMCNETLDLGLSVDELSKIGLEVGADVPFFIHGFKSANVSGIGEIVEEFIEDSLSFEIKTPDIQISTPVVYKLYSKNFYAPIDKKQFEELRNIKSLDVLNSFSDTLANDLLLPALEEHRELKDYRKDGWFFSGSGSSFFRLKIKDL